MKDMEDDSTGFNSGIRDLNLREATDETLKQVAELPALQGLFLAEPKCTDAGYASLQKSSLPLHLQIALPWSQRRDAKVFGARADDTSELPIKRFLSPKKPRACRPGDQDIGMPDDLDRHEVPLPEANGQSPTEYGSGMP